MSKVPIHFIQACLEGAAQRQVDIGQILLEAGIPSNIYHSEPAWVSREQYVSLVQAVRTVMRDEFFGLTEKPCPPGLFTTSARLTSHMRSLISLLDEWINLNNLVQRELTLSIENDGNRTGIVLTLRNPELDKKHFLTEFTLVTLHRFCSWLTGKRLQLQQIEFAYPCPAHHQYYEHLFPCDILFDGSRTVMYLNSQHLKSAPIRSRDELACALDNAPAAFIDLPDDDNFKALTIRAMLTYFRKHERFPNSEEMADILAVSQTTLRRNLKKDCTSYQELKDQLRLDLAREKLLGQDDALEKIAFDLGFSDQATFARAFKRWTNQSPARFREQNINGNTYAAPADRTIHVPQRLSAQR